MKKFRLVLLFNIEKVFSCPSGWDGNEPESLQEIGNNIIDNVCKCRTNDSSKEDN